ncbi:NAD(P)-dependent oxidoreductase [Amycolatopsis endophytica]|uniref:3-hydroxyisobutyrate dehydrogenase-like beta-hydroxyacid dehydrogenase n=1 Tax=Amycolatopsis endophytica TaxID=860233 RepID=A0A853BET8_9PSEU|nr:NAD(P)-dependent oxidoreductase [Amycolatopsis endophytica]NYI92986.1 3-hydroxyisobutyrate dehydrogenase-like beta-hydroxyacid dehydrogenase [Amycolatopsis endophytica]
MPEPIGVIGTGAMGSRFARRLAGLGHPVHAWNRTPARVEALQDAGVVAQSTPRAVAERCELLVCMVWDSEALRSVARGPGGFIAGMSHRHVVLDASTVEPEVSAEIATAVAGAGAAMLDTPVSGSLDAAESGRLMIMSSGPVRAFDRARPVLDALARSVRHVSEVNGSALALKLAINLQVALQEVAWGEGLALAAEFGIDRVQATSVMLDSVIASPMLHYRAPFVLDPPGEVWASSAQLLKDVSYAVARSGGHAVAGRHARDLLAKICGDERADREAAELMIAVADGERPDGPTR